MNLYLIKASLKRFNTAPLDSIPKMSVFVLINLEELKIIVLFDYALTYRLLHESCITLWF